MFQNIYPVFETKKLLKKEMLDSLRDFPRELFDLQYRGYSDGILMGCELEGYEGGLKIMPGILYYQGIPYFLKRPFDISVQADGNLAYLKVRFLGKTVGARQEEYLSQIYIDGRIPDTNCELELGRFKLQVGARLRTEYVDFGDYATEFDTMDRIQVPYAALGQHGIWPQLLKCFAKELLQFSKHDMGDIAFCLDCLQLEKAMPYEAVKAYLNVRLRQDRDYTNQQVYSALRNILRESKGKENASIGEIEKREKTLLMI